MKALIMWYAVAVLAVPAAVSGAGGDPQPAGPMSGKEGRVVAENVVARNATVKAIDMKKRTVTLQLPDGKEETFVVDKAVRRLGEIKVGDTVKARYREAVSVKLNKVKVPSGVRVEGTVQPEEKSVTPAGTASLKATTTATIDRIHDEGRMVTLRLPDGETADVKVRDQENLAKIRKGEVKEGDQIEITYYRAVALSVEKAGRK